MTKVIVCAPAEYQSDICPAGHALSVQEMYIPPHDIYSLTTSDFQVAAFAFALVLVSYIAGLTFSLLFNLFRSS